MLTDFGHKLLSIKDKTEAVRHLFNRVAPQYDLMNDVMSLGVHRLWKQWFVSALLIQENMRILDLAGGTGDISRLIIKKFGHFSPEITIVDLTENMLVEGRDKAIDSGITVINWVCGSAESIPLDSESVDLCTLTFGLRNFSDRQQALIEISRILKPGSWLYCLEFHEPTFPITGKLGSRWLYQQYRTKIIPLLGQYIASDKDAYNYLSESIEQFPPSEEVRDWLGNAGFSTIKQIPYSGGLAWLHMAQK